MFRYFIKQYNNIDNKNKLLFILDVYINYLFSLLKKIVEKKENINRKIIIKDVSFLFKKKYENSKKYIIQCVINISKSNLYSIKKSKTISITMVVYGNYIYSLNNTLSLSVFYFFLQDYLYFVFYKDFFKYTYGSIKNYSYINLKYSLITLFLKIHGKILDILTFLFFDSINILLFKKLSLKNILFISYDNLIYMGLYNKYLET
jgi:hypothetical protein